MDKERKRLRDMYKVCRYCKNENTWSENKTYSDNSYSGMCQVCSCGRYMAHKVIEENIEKDLLSY